MTNQTSAQPAPGDFVRAQAFTAAPEPLTPSLPDFLALVAQNQATTAAPFAPLPAVFEQIEAAGLALFVGLRDGFGALVGGTFSVVRPHPHYVTTETGFTDLLTAPDAAGAAMLLSATEEAMKARGVARWFLREDEGQPHATPPAEHGFRAVERQYEGAV